MECACFKLYRQRMHTPFVGRFIMRRSIAIRLSLLLLLAVLPGMTGCNGFFVPVCVETDTCPATGTSASGVPVVSSISPTFGPVGGGTAVTIFGTNFASGAIVDFGSTPGNVTAISATSITVTSPAASSGGVVNVTVTTSGGTSVGNLQFTYSSTAGMRHSPFSSGLRMR